jgi:hypothetical protein
MAMPAGWLQGGVVFHRLPWEMGEERQSLYKTKVFLFHLYLLNEKQENPMASLFCSRI